MNGKTLHIVSHLTLCGTLDYGLELSKKKEEEVAYLPIDLSIGYIPKDFSDKELCFSLASHNQIDQYDNLKRFVTTDYSIYDKIIVWHGWSAYDLLLLYLMSVLVNGVLYKVDIRECDAFMQDHLSKHPSEQYPDMGYVSPVYVPEMLHLAKPICDEDKQYYKEQWNKWATSRSPYRFSDIHTGVIEEYPEDFMDASIIDEARKNSRFSRITHNVFWKFGHLYISERMVIKRIMELRQKDVLELFVSIKENETN